MRQVTVASLAVAFFAIAVSTAAPRPAGQDLQRSERARSQLQWYAAAASYAYPLKPSSNRRYLVDQRNVPFLIIGDSPQAMIGNLSVKDAAFYIANRQAAGFNALWVNLLCVKYTGCRGDGTTFDGIRPFTSPGDLSTPNPAYFARVDAMIRLAAKARIVVFLDPIETGGWLSVLQKNGLAKDRAYGRFLGRRYKSFGNIVWMSGNDFQTWTNPSDDAVALAVAKGIRSADPAHIQTVELNVPVSGSLDDRRWRSVIGLDAAYTYAPTYAQVLKEYGRQDHLPVVMIEAGYEFEQNQPSYSYGDPQILRKQEYWSVLSGATGQFYGNHYTWQFTSGWKSHLNTAGSAQLRTLERLFIRRPWFRLVPDQMHKVVTAGYGTATSQGNVNSSNYVTTASTPDGRLAISYLPRGGTIAIDLARLGGHVHARWYDPVSGRYTSDPGSPFSSQTSVRLSAPGRNAGGDRDWVLVLTATPHKIRLQWSGR